MSNSGTDARIDGRGTPRRPRRRLLGVALLTLPVLELALIITVGRAVGVLATLLLLALGAMAGVVVLRRVTAAATRRLAAAGVLGSPFGGPPGTPATAAANLPPAPPGAALLVPAGLLLIVPGFLSDLAGLLLLVPAVRRALAARMGEAVVRRLNLRAVRVMPGQVVDGPIEVHVTDLRPDAPGTPRALPRPE